MAESLALTSPETDKPREACGVFGIYAPGKNVATLTYLGLHELQHRGQDAAGMALANPSGNIQVDSNLGLVGEVFPRGVKDWDEYSAGAGIAIGHDRYGTIKTNNRQEKLRAVHPLMPDDKSFAAAFNGHIANYEALGRKYGYGPDEYITDSECFTLILGDLKQKQPNQDVVPALAELIQEALGAISMVLTDGQRLVAARDRNGFRPLCIGEFPDGGYVVASEPPAIEIVGAVFTRNVEPGEIVVIDEKGLQSHQVEAPKTTFCSLEYAYFSRPDSTLYSRNVHVVRESLGRRLAQEHPLTRSQVDMVIGVPDSGVSASLGYAKELGLPTELGLTKSRYVPRTFIKDNQLSREQSAAMKYHPNRWVVEGQRLVVVDDSLIRGTTTKTLVQMLYDKGAKEVHLRIASPQNKFSCHYGMDTGDQNELLANILDGDVEAMRQYVGADSLAFISIEGLEESITGVRNQRLGKLCLACMDGKYPTDVPAQAKRLPLLST